MSANARFPARTPRRTGVMLLIVTSEVAQIVRPAWAFVAPVRVVAREERLDAPLRQTEDAMRAATESGEVTAAVRTMYKRVGLDPTKTRPSSEALLRRVRKGDALPRVNNVVDVINWGSLESRLPFGLYDADQLRGHVTLRLGAEGESYAGIRKEVVHVGGRLTLVDDGGPFGNPTSDSARTMVTLITARVLVVVFAPAILEPAVAQRALTITEERIRSFCA